MFGPIKYISKLELINTVMRVMCTTAQQRWTHVVSSRLVGTIYEIPKAGLRFKQSKKTA
jgi:hypothetical protein